MGEREKGVKGGGGVVRRRQLLLWGGVHVLRRASKAVILAD